MLGIELPNSGQTSWTADWPTQEGVYWFHGFPWGKKYATENDQKPDLLCVLVRRISNGFLYVTEGYCLEKTALGVWTPAVLPDYPIVRT